MRRLSMLMTLAGMAAAVVGSASGTRAAVAGAPLPPSGLTANLVSGSVALAWSDNSADETGFSIERCMGANCTAFGQIATVGAGMTSYADAYYAVGTGPNRYRVRAFNGAGHSTYTDVAEIGVLGGGEVFPSIAATPTVGQAPLTVSLDGSASYALNGTISSWLWSFGDNQTASGTVVSHTYASPGVYAATLKAVSAGVFGSANSVAVIITVAPPPLVAPGNLTAAPLTGGRVRLAWENPVSSATSLVLERCKGATCTSFVSVAILTTSTTSYVDTSSKRNTTYSYRLAASDATATVYSNTAVVSTRR